ncbi:Gfo/Idh/MocA family protein [Haladaptatus sp. NG-SE-30]
MTRIGILSTAHVHTDEYAEKLASFDDVDFVGVASENVNDGRETASRHGTEYFDTTDLLEQVEGVVVCSPNATHIDWIQKAAKAGVDVLCEKPLAPDYGTAKEIVDICENAGINAGLCMPLRFNPLAREAKQDYLEDSIGDLRYITGTNRGKMPGDWFVNPELAGGGAVMDHTVHVLNIVRWITGLEVSEVYAETDTLIFDIPVEDVNILSMELEDGTPFTLDGSWSRPDEWDTWGDVTLEMLGTNGTAGFDSTELTMKVTRDSGENTGIQSIGFGEDANEGLVRDFVNSVESDREPMTTVQDGATEVAVIDAAYESAKREEPITVKY